MTEQSIPKLRTPRVELEDVPKDWFAHSIAVSQVANGVNLLFPAGERFFIRSVRRYLDRVQVSDPDLAAQVRGFFGQEGRHAYAHERFFDTMRAQGYEIDELLASYERFAYGFLEKKAPARLRLAITVALEHFTAILAEDALSGEGLDGAHPAMKQLLTWHAVEELEHKAVAFDVMRAVHPSYALRIAGLFAATAALGGFWIHMTKQLLEQDGMTFREGVAELKEIRKHAPPGSLTKPIARRVFWKGIKSYLRPGFHPNDRDHAALIRDSLARLEEDGVLTADVAQAAE